MLCRVLSSSIVWMLKAYFDVRLYIVFTNVGTTRGKNNHLVLNQPTPYIVPILGSLSFPCYDKDC